MIEADEWNIQFAWQIPTIGYFVLVLILLLSTLATFLPWFFRRCADLFRVHRSLEPVQTLRWSPAKFWSPSKLLTITGFRLLIAVLLFGLAHGPVVQWWQFEMPVVHIILDDSASLGELDSQSKEGTDFQCATDWLRERLVLANGAQERSAESSKVRYTFSTLSGKRPRPTIALEDWLAELSPYYDQSPIGDAIVAEANSRYSDACIVLLTDGYVTQGLSLESAARRLASANKNLHIVGLGRVPQNQRTQIVDVHHPSSAFIGDDVTIDAILADYQADSSQPSPSTRHQNIASPAIRLEAFDEARNEWESIRQEPITGSQARVRFQAPIPRAGNNEFRLAIVQQSTPTEPSAATTDSDWIVFSIEGREEPIRVLLISQRPTYEFRFVQQFLSRTRQPLDVDTPAFDVRFWLGDADRRFRDQQPEAIPTLPVTSDQFDEFDVVVLFSVEPEIFTQVSQNALVDYVAEKQGSLLVVTDFSTMPHAYSATSFAKLLPIKLPFGESQSFARGEWHVTPDGERLGIGNFGQSSTSEFSLAELPPTKFQQGIELKPAAMALATAMSAKSSAQRATREGFAATLADAIRERRNSLLIFQYFGTGRVLFQNTDETFRWQRFRGDNELCDRYWLQLLQLLADARIQKGPIDLTVSPNTIQQGETATVRLRVMGRTKSDLETESAEMKIAIYNNLNGELLQKLQLNQTDLDEQEWTASLAGLDKGNYDVVLEMAQQETGVRTTINVESNLAEFQKAAPAGPLMEQAATLTGGKFYWIDQSETLLTEISKATTSEKTPGRRIPIWNHWLTFCVMVSLLGIEWYLRQRLA